jgi:hypothetical protein
MAGETEASVSAWTTDTVLAHLRELIDERDRRYEQRFEGQEKAVAAALAAQEKAVAAALSAADRAVSKAELAAEKRFEAVNEFRGQLADQAGRLLPRSEADVALGGVREKIDGLTGRVEALGTRLERGEGQRSGLKDGWGYLVGAAGFVATLIAIAYALAK